MISTKRLRLSKPSEADFSLFSDILSCPRQTRFLPNEAPYTIQQQHTYLDNRIRHWQKHGFGTFVMSLATEEETKRSILAHTPTKVGFVGIEYMPNSNWVDLRFALSKEYEGLGYVSEAARAVLDFATHHTHLTEIYGAAMPDNMASKAVLTKLGMTPIFDVNLYDSDELDCFSLVLKLNSSRKRGRG